jgi:MerR HTH family regulatory protein
MATTTEKLHQVCDRLECTPRQLDLWIHNGLINVTVDIGSGYKRDYTTITIEQIRNARTVTAVTAKMTNPPHKALLDELLLNGQIVHAGVIYKPDTTTTTETTSPS